MQVLDPNDPGLARNRLGIDPMGTAPLGTALADATPGGRSAKYVLVSDQGVVHDGRDLMPAHWSRAFDPNGVGFAVIVLGAIVFLLHARADVAVRGAIGGRR
jgi:hypothetical protein